MINYLHLGNADKKYSLSIKRMTLIAVLAAYGFYLFLFFIIKNFNIYNSPSTPLGDIFNIRNILIGFSSAWFNLAYNGFLVNAAPIMAAPLVIDVNLNLRLFLNSMFEINPVVLISIGGSIVFLSMVYFLIYLYKGGQRQYLKLTSVSLILYFSQAFTLLFLRLATNDIYFGITQFRYMYMFNIFTFLLAAVLISCLTQLYKRFKYLILGLLPLIILFNILVTRNYGLKLLNDQLAPLSSMLSDIKINLENGAINKEHKLFIDDDIVNFLPRLCWNREMGERFMHGTYQWVFPRKYIDGFTFSNQDSYWVIDKETFDIVRR
ncbi:MAG: hypothetical protein PHQ54_01870 [Candidatus Omnitrophica bacterium]|nr:hypothetical protein [Candidatus Omnitrophota bacterium]